MATKHVVNLTPFHAVSKMFREHGFLEVRIICRVTPRVFCYHSRNSLSNLHNTRTRSRTSIEVFPASNSPTMLGTNSDVYNIFLARIHDEELRLVYMKESSCRFQCTTNQGHPSFTLHRALILLEGFIWHLLLVAVITGSRWRIGCVGVLPSASNQTQSGQS